MIVTLSIVMGIFIMNKNHKKAYNRGIKTSFKTGPSNIRLFLILEGLFYVLFWYLILFIICFKYVVLEDWK